MANVNRDYSELVFSDAVNTIIKRTVSEREVIISQALIDRLAAECDRKLGVLFYVNKNPVHCVSNGRGEIYASLRLPILPLKAPYKLVGDYMVPNLSSDGDPILPLNWVPPADMALYHLFLAAPLTGGGFRFLQQTVWLAARDGQGNFWRLPLGNLYDDCSLCTGIKLYESSSLQGAIEKVLTQMEKSDWNADLWRTVSETQKLFRFKPHDTGFEQMPTPENLHWTKLCQKVSVEVFKKFIFA